MGKTYLSDIEYNNRKKIISDRYFKNLANSVLFNENGRKLLDFHRSLFNKIGRDIDLLKLTRHLFFSVIDMPRHPKLVLRFFRKLIAISKLKSFKLSS